MHKYKFLFGILFSATFCFFSCKSKNKNASGTADSTKDSSTAVKEVKPGSAITLSPNKKYIFITWDDDPQPPGTSNCIRVFKEQGIKATFFSVGMNAYDPLRKRIIDTLRNSYPQLLLANHSWSHARNRYRDFYAHPDSALQDFLKMQTTYNVPVKIVRLPGMNSWVLNKEISGQKTPYEVCKRLDSLGYSVIGWDTEWMENKTSPKQSADEMIATVRQKLNDGTTKAQNAIVILSHDRLFSKAQYVDSLTKFISALKQDTSYVFETIDHYPLVQNQ
ncbi:MAG: polysaccharide deacetylase family protein [Arachidicoccus sp.]|nr:polysaccharide deacetylase family protein [Arachidicoccus sp.]